VRSLVLGCEVNLCARQQQRAACGQRQAAALAHEQ
jgi:hypothetical protein